ncbi:MAG: beta-lactamase family protein [Verrucomicrobia bacterium]|nr:beta-lactamase family protein [Verrucomicrobiota bacterium]
MDMINTAATHRRTLRRVLTGALLLGLAWLCFRLFEPIFVWNIGWQPLPAMAENEALRADAEFVDAEWRELGAPAAKRLRDARAKLETPALSAAVSIYGKRVWAGAVGLADVESQRYANLDSRFRLGSTSKAVTAVAIGTLLDAGRLDLELPAQHYIADLAPPLATITTRQAMSHTAGVRNYGLCLCFPIWEQYGRRSFANTRAALRVFERDPLLFTPGEDFAYSSYGYNIAGAVIEAATQTPFLDYLQRAVFDPLKMTHSGGDFADVSVADRVSFYDTADGSYKPAYRVDNSVKLPSGGLLSSPSDMVALGSAMLSDRLLSVATRERLLTPQRLADGRENPQGYALGWRVSDQKKFFNDSLTTRIIHHHGAAVGSTSYFAALPEFGLVISVMMNKGQENLDSLAPEATALVDLFLAELQRRDAVTRESTPNAAGK